jgi:NAD(P)-dependent dehydrogenase (short-subunit alcohol dehydrogenase family)
MFDAVEAAFNRVDVLVNNPGIRRQSVKGYVFRFGAGSQQTKQVSAERPGLAFAVD